MYIYKSYYLKALPLKIVKTILKVALSNNEAKQSIDSN